MGEKPHRWKQKIMVEVSLPVQTYQHITLNLISLWQIVRENDGFWQHVTQRLFHVSKHSHSVVRQRDTCHLTSTFLKNLGLPYMDRALQHVLCLILLCQVSLGGPLASERDLAACALGRLGPTGSRKHSSALLVSCVPPRTGLSLCSPAQGVAGAPWCADVGHLHLTIPVNVQYFLPGTPQPPNSLKISENVEYHRDMKRVWFPKPVNRCIQITLALGLVKSIKIRICWLQWPKKVNFIV